MYAGLRPDASIEVRILSGSSPGSMMIASRVSSSETRKQFRVELAYEKCLDLHVPLYFMDMGFKKPALLDTIPS